MYNCYIVLYIEQVSDSLHIQKFEPVWAYTEKFAVQNVREKCSIHTRTHFVSVSLKQLVDRTYGHVEEVYLATYDFITAHRSLMIAGIREEQTAKHLEYCRSIRLAEQFKMHNRELDVEQTKEPVVPTADKIVCWSCGNPVSLKPEKTYFHLIDDNTERQICTRCYNAIRKHGVCTSCRHIYISKYGSCSKCSNSDRAYGTLCEDCGKTVINQPMIDVPAEGGGSFEICQECASKRDTVPPIPAPAPDVELAVCCKKCAHEFYVPIDRPKELDICPNCDADGANFCLR